MLIDCSFFESGPRHIQNASLGGVPNPAAFPIRTAIMSYISEYQTEFLCAILGHDNGVKMDVYLRTLDDRLCENDEKLDVICAMIKDAYADYVFYRMLADTGTQATLNGLARVKIGGNEAVAPIRRQCEVWNRMVERNNVFQQWARTDACPIKGIEVDSNLLTKINHFNI